MKYEAMRHQGKKGGLTLDVMSGMLGESKRSLQRYISLSHLSDELLDKIDSKQIPPLAGVLKNYSNQNLAVLINGQILISVLTYIYNKC